MHLRWPTWLSHLVKWQPPLPSLCLACRTWPCHDVLCPDCAQCQPSPAFRCAGCALALPGLHPQQPRCGRCLRHPPPWREAHAWRDYHYPWSMLVTRWKFGQEPGLATHFARWMLQDPALQWAVTQAEVVLPIPLSLQRLRERGYNPAAQLTQLLCPQPQPMHLLQRSRHTLAQSGLTRAQRLRNLRHAFVIPPEQQHLVAGRKVLLVDDVMTTGATFDRASRCLLQAGAREVSVLCLARTP